MQAKTRGIVKMAVCAAMWSIAGIFIKLLDWHPMVIAAFRSLVAAAVVAVYMKLSGTGFMFNRQTVKLGVAVSALLCCFVCANKLTTSANAIVLQYCAPIMLLLYSAIVRHQRFRTADYIVVAATFAGIAMFFFDQLGGGKLIGNCVALLSGCMFAAMFLLSGDCTTQERFNGILLGQLITVAFGIPFLLAGGTNFASGDLIWILGLGIIQLGLPYILFTLAVKDCPPLMCSILAVLEPLLNPVWVFLFTGEAPGAWALLGGAIVLSSVTVWCIYDARRPQPAAETPSSQA